MNPLLNPTRHSPLRVIVVGGGLAGLTCALTLSLTGHIVTVYEQARELREVGAGITVPPNSVRILNWLSVLTKQTLTVANSSIVRCWKDGAELQFTRMLPDIPDKYGAPTGSAHRGDLQRDLLDACKRSRVRIRPGLKVIQVDDGSQPRVHLSDGCSMECDLVIAADGVKSTVMKQMLSEQGHVHHAVPTGDAAWRMTIPREKLLHDHEALQLLENPQQIRWLGPNSHVVVYTVKDKQLLNVVAAHPARPDDSGEESWTRKGNKQDMIDYYKDWDPLLQRLISYAPDGELMEWTLYTHDPLPTWHFNRVVGVGDAVHPMLPYVAQGAAQGVEDAAVLAVALKQTPDISLALDVWEYLRKPRGEALQRSGAGMRTALHLPNGPEQRARDAAWRAAAEGKGDMAAQAATEAFMDEVWGRDVANECCMLWDEHVARLPRTAQDVDSRTVRMLF